jgi:hypothetical protein
MTGSKQAKRTARCPGLLITTPNVYKKKVISVEQVDYFVDVPIASPLQLLIFFFIFLFNYFSYATFPVKCSTRAMLRIVPPRTKNPSYSSRACLLFTQPTRSPASLRPLSRQRLDENFKKKTAGWAKNIHYAV